MLDQDPTAWVLPIDGFLPPCELEGPCSALLVPSGNFVTTNLPVDLSSSSPCFILTSSQLKGASAVLVNSFRLIANFGFTFITISAASCKSTLPLMFFGARSNVAHSSSNLPGFGLAAFVIRLLVDSSVYANCVSAFLPKNNGSIDSENFAILLSFVSKALNMGVCTKESAPSNILLIKVSSGISSGSFCSRQSLSSLLSHCATRQINEEFRHSSCYRASSSRVSETLRCALCLLHPFGHGNDHQNLVQSSLALIPSLTANLRSSILVTHFAHTN